MAAGWTRAYASKEYDVLFCCGAFTEVAPKSGLTPGKLFKRMTEHRADGNNENMLEVFIYQDDSGKYQFAYALDLSLDRDGEADGPFEHWCLSIGIPYNCELEPVEIYEILKKRLFTVIDDRVVCVVWDARIDGPDKLKVTDNKADAVTKIFLDDRNKTTLPVKPFEANSIDPYAHFRSSPTLAGQKIKKATITSLTL